MGMEPADIEGEAHGLILEAGEDPDDPPGAIAIARKLLGHDAVRTTWIDNLDGNARLVWEWGKARIYLRRNLTFAAANRAVSHEVGEWSLTRAGYREDDRERVADAIGAALMMPPRAFRRSYAAAGFCLPDLAAEYIAPEGAVALRVGEVCMEPVALLVGARILRRDPHNDLPDDARLLRLARQTLDEWHPVQMVQCRDALRTIAFRRVS